MRIGIGLGLGLLASVALAPVAVVDFTLGVMPSWLTFTATGNRMQWDSTGKLTYGPNNLLTYSSDWSNAAWSKINAGTGSAPLSRLVLLIRLAERTPIASCLRVAVVLRQVTIR